MGRVCGSSECYRYILSHGGDPESPSEYICCGCGAEGPMYDELLPEDDWDDDDDYDEDYYDDEYEPDSKPQRQKEYRTVDDVMKLLKDATKDLL
ncbi:MAG: hypothetical protein II332_05275 [Kiritimatiellae bacterium]|nr:hypothetical protein [Kiritimatiellia bacterium]